MGTFSALLRRRREKKKGFKPSKAVLEAPKLPDHAGVKPRRLQTFFVSEKHVPTREKKEEVGRAILQAFQEDSIVNISMDGICNPEVVKEAYKAQRAFFEMPIEKKMSCTNDRSYAGYVYSGEESTGGKKDAAEIFTVTREFPLSHPLVKKGMPCHGPTPWPSPEFQTAMTKYAEAMRSIGDKVLPLIALGLGMEEDAFVDLTKDSWGHMRVLKFRDRRSTDMPGISSHTDYGMLVLATQDEAGGLWCRPPNDKSTRQGNWVESAAGAHEEEGGWLFVVPEPGVVTCFPGDILEFISKNRIKSTLHKVKLAEEERYAIAYFHEPSFGANVRQMDTGEAIHYGTHFTNMFKRCYPDKPVTKRIIAANLEENLVVRKEEDPKRPSRPAMLHPSYQQSFRFG